MNAGLNTKVVFRSLELKKKKENKRMIGKLHEIVKPSHRIATTVNDSCTPRYPGCNRKSFELGQSNRTHVNKASAKSLNFYLERFFFFFNFLLVIPRSYIRE